MSDTIKTAAEALVKKAQDFDRLKEYWHSLPDVTKSTLTNSLIGAGAGGAAGGTLGGLAGEGVGSSALIGALLGGTVGGAGSLGWDMVRGGVNLPGEQRRPGSLVDRGVDVLGNTALHHPGMAAGAGIAGTVAGFRWPYTAKARNALGQSSVLELGSDSAGRFTSLFDALAQRGRNFDVPAAAVARPAPGSKINMDRLHEYVGQVADMHRESEGIRSIARKLEKLPDTRLLRLLRHKLRKIPGIGNPAANAVRGATRIPAHIGSDLVHRLATGLSRHKLLSAAGTYSGHGLTAPGKIGGIAGSALLGGYLLDRYLQGNNQ